MSYYERRTKAENLMEPAKSLARMAICCQTKMQPLKRDEIVKKILNGDSKLFSATLEEAKSMLRGIYGLDLVEWQSYTPDPKSKGNFTAAPLKKYSLVSLLRQHNSSLADLNINHNLNNDSDVSQSRKYSLLLLLLSLIYLSFGMISEESMRGFLKKFGFRQSTSAADDLVSNEFGKLSELLSEWTRQSYLERVASGHAGSSSNSTANPDRKLIEWRWGPRAKVEISRHDIISFIIDIQMQQQSTTASDSEQEMRKKLEKQGSIHYSDS